MGGIGREGSGQAACAIGCGGAKCVMREEKNREQSKNAKVDRGAERKKTINPAQKKG